MDYQAIKDAILTGTHAAACAPYVILPSDPKVPGHIARERDQAIADILNTGGVMTERISRTIGIGTVLDVLGPVDGASVLDALDAARAQNSVLRWGWHLLERAELDVGLNSTRATLQGLVGAGVSQSHVDSLLSLAEHPIMISGADVSIALRGGD